MTDQAYDVRIDYLKFLFEADHDQFQAHQHSTWMSIIVHLDLSPDNRSVHNLTVLPRKAGERSRYIIEIWGEHADEAARLVPLHWWANLRRCDWRRVMHNVSGEEFRGAVRWLALQPHSINRSLLESKPRHKRGASRDVGGIGIYYGSRRSSQHAVYYKRGKENPAYEYRAQDKLALAIGQRVIEGVQAGEWAQPYHAIHAEMGKAALDFSERCLGANMAAEMAYAVAQGQKLADAAAQLNLFDETDEERRWWSELTPEEQFDLQRVTVEPTPQGWREAPQSQAASELAVNPDLSHDDPSDHSLPF